MGATDFGTQDIVVHYLDPADSERFDKIAQNVRLLGIYEGVYPTKVNDTTVTIGTGEFEIQSDNDQGDGTRRQIRVRTTASENISISTGSPYLVLRYSFETNNSHFVDMLNVTTPAADDLVIAKGLFSGSTLTGFDFEERSIPEVFHRFARVVPTVTPSLKVKVRGGRALFGNSKFELEEQDSPLFTTPGSNSKIDLLYVDTDGALLVAQGVVAASPVAPDYCGRLVLAEISLAAGQTEINEADINDARPYLLSSGAYQKDVSGVPELHYKGEGPEVQITNAGELNLPAQLGKLVKYSHQQSGTMVTFAGPNTAIPRDNTVPQSFEGVQMTTITHTPDDVANILVVEFNGVFHHETGIDELICLFKDSETSARAVQASWDTAHRMKGHYLRYQMVAGTTSPITFRLRAGGDGTGAVTMSGASGTAYYGGTLLNVFRVTEYLPA